MSCPFIHTLRYDDQHLHRFIYCKGVNGRFIAPLGTNLKEVCQYCPQKKEEKWEFDR